MPIELLNDPSSHFRISTMKSESLLTNIISENLSLVESGTQHLLEAIILTRKQIEKSLEEHSQFDVKKIHEALEKINKRLDAIEKRLDSHTDDEHSCESEEESKYEFTEKQELAPTPKKKKEKIEKSIVVFDIMPADSKTDFDKLIALIKEINLEGLEWGEFLLEDFCFGIKKLRAACILENEKTSTDQIEGLIMGFEEYVQSVVISAFQNAG